MNKTIKEYKEIIEKCKTLFLDKTKDYGTSWRILRLSSLTDQIFIKANRIRTIQELKSNKIEETEIDEFVGIINYSIISLIQIDLIDKNEVKLEIDVDEINKLYNNKVKETMELMINKNHDYGEAWRNMRVSSLTDLILQKLLRIKQIENNNGSTIVSEGVKSGYQDILNYAIFSIILLNYE